MLYPTSPVWISGDIVSISGYDNLVLEAIRSLRRAGITAYFNERFPLDRNLVPRGFANLVRPRGPNDWEIIIRPPCVLPWYRPGHRSIVLTMWESDHLEPRYVDELNRARLVLVPSQWGIDCFRRSGVAVPMYRVPLGYDAGVCTPTQGPPAECVFGTAAALHAGGVRKNTQRIIEAFLEAFPSEPVQLQVKLTPRCQLPDYDDRRIKVLRTFLQPAELADWYRSLTAFVSASAAEGFGLHLVEAMACGRPLITPAYSAVTEYFDETVGYPVAHHIVPASGAVYTGNWAEPDQAALVERLREVYHDRQEASRRGARAAERARDYTWTLMGRRIARVLLEKGALRYAA